MTPAHVISVLRDFGRAAGIGDFSLNARDSAAVRFDSGATLRFEYCFDGLTVAMTVPCRPDPAAMRRLLEYSRPSPRGGARPVRAGYLAKTGCAVFAVRIPEEAVTAPAVNAAFADLWRIVNEFGRLR